MISRSKVAMLEHFGFFEAGGHKWRLIIYPTGNPQENCQGYMSLYLDMVDTCSMIFGWEVDVTLRIFLYNHIREEYMMLEESSGACFSEAKKRWGFSQFISLKAFYNASNGYLVNDECILGAEVFITNEKRPCRNESLLLLGRHNKVNFFWKIENFSKSIQSPNNSVAFKVEEYQWMIMLHIARNGATGCQSLSLNLLFMGADDLPPECKVYANYTLCIVDQRQCLDFSRNGSDWFGIDESCGWQNFIQLSELYDPEKGFVRRDKCLIEADVSIFAVSSVS